jgi:DnaK suppressor protein
MKRSELVRNQATQLDALYAPDKHHLADLDEMASDTVDTDSLCALVDMSSDTLEQIDAALERIEAGTYGSCEKCRRPIAPERLEFLPFAAQCVECQRRSETEKG